MAEKTIGVAECDSDEFHCKVAGWEARGYRPLLDTYKIAPEMDPYTGRIWYLHSIDMEMVAREED